MSTCPENFKVVALMATYNEADIVFHSIKKLIDQRIYVYVIDNWSNDGTYEIIKGFTPNKYFLGSEKFPHQGPAQYYCWRQILARKEELSSLIDADWFIHHDTDEVRESPWLQLNLREGIYRVDSQGYNAIDHIVLNFCPVDNGFKPGQDFENYFKYFELNQNPGDANQIKTWKNTHAAVKLATYAGHEVSFPGRRVYPDKFLLKHYPIRSQVQGENKVFQQRKPRWHPEEKAAGWHTHYDRYQQGCNFIFAAKDLQYFDKELFYRQYYE